MSIGYDRSSVSESNWREMVDNKQLLAHSNWFTIRIALVLMRDMNQYELTNENWQSVATIIVDESKEYHLANNESFTDDTLFDIEYSTLLHIGYKFWNE